MESHPAYDETGLTEPEPEHPYPIGCRVAVLADVTGADVLGTIAGHVTYAHPETGAPQDGYAIHLDRGAYLDRSDLPPGRRPYIGTIVAHRDAVTPWDAS